MIPYLIVLICQFLLQSAVGPIVAVATDEAASSGTTGPNDVDATGGVTGGANQPQNLSDTNDGPKGAQAVSKQKTLVPKLKWSDTDDHRESAIHLYYHSTHPLCMKHFNRVDELAVTMKNRVQDLKQALRLSGVGEEVLF